MAGDKQTRRVNAWIAAIITALFFAHACLGCIVLFVPGFPKNLEWIVWVGVAAFTVHIVLSIITTWQMFTDEVRPPSSRKKGHQVKKWVTGGLLVAVVVIHLTLLFADVLVPACGIALTLGVVAILLCIHVCTGVKSLTRDLDVSQKARTPIRAIAIVLCVVLCAALLFYIL